MLEWFEERQWPIKSSHKSSVKDHRFPTNNVNVREQQEILFNTVKLLYKKERMHAGRIRNNEQVKFLQMGKLHNSLSIFSEFENAEMDYGKTRM